MNQHDAIIQGYEALENIELSLRCLVGSFRKVNNEGPAVRCLAELLDHAVYLREGVRPAILTRHVYRELSVEYVAQIGIMVRDRGYATEQVADSSPQHAGIARRTQAFLDGWLFGVMNICGPIAPAWIGAASQPWKERELQMVMSIDEPGKDDVAGEIDRSFAEGGIRRVSNAGHGYAFDPRST